MKCPLALAILLPSLLGGCSFFQSAIDQAEDVAGGKVGSAIGDRVGTAIAGKTVPAYDQMSPQMTQAYAMGLFASVFYYGGYSWTGRPYRPGEYTQWSSDDKGTFFEKAFLKTEANGQEWWRVTTRDKDEEGKDAVFEALFSKPDANAEQQIVRMRAKMPNETTASEVPITEENKSGWVLRPSVRLRPESMQGATIGYETITVPAGSFRTRHVRFAQMGAHVDWWLSDDVPGGMVKYSVTGSDDEEHAVLQLAKTGKDAKSRL